MTNLCRSEKLYEDVPITNFAIYAVDSAEVGKVLDVMSYVGNGEATIKIVNDDAGNTCYCITGWTDHKSQIDEVARRCVQQGVKAQFSY